MGDLDPDVQVAIITTIGLLGSAFLASVTTVAIQARGKRAREGARLLGEVHEQVANTHNTNLRVDMDGFGTDIKKIIATQASHGRALRRDSDAIAALRIDVQATRADILATRGEVQGLTERANTNDLAAIEQRRRLTDIEKKRG